MRQFWNITSGIYAKYHVQIMLLFVYTTTHKRFVIFTCRYFKLSWNSTALSQSNCRNFSCSSIKDEKLISFHLISKHSLHINFLCIFYELLMSLWMVNKTQCRYLAGKENGYQFNCYPDKSVLRLSTRIIAMFLFS